jgi:hypothetical protein
MRWPVAFFLTCSFIIVPALVTAWGLNFHLLEVAAPLHIIHARFPNELEYFAAVDQAHHGSAPIEETFHLLLDSTNALILPRIEPEHMRFYGVLETPPSPIQVAPPPQERKVQPRNAMFNDAQIASIKARLRLDKNQEQHWVPVELALRRIVWRGASSSGPQLDPMSIQSLAIASTALIAELHEHQKRELRVFARLMGLDKLAAQL